VYAVPDVADETPLVHDDAVCSLYSIFFTLALFFELQDANEYVPLALMYVPSAGAAVPDESDRFAVSAVIDAG
jgi:hypothetical protein